MRSLLAVLVLASSIWGSACSGCGDNSSVHPDAAADAPPDASEPDPGVTEVVCEALPALPAGTCEVSGSGAGKLLKGNVLTPTKLYRGGQVAVNAAGTISCVGCNCAAADQTVITCPGAAISPGLINTHDHITFTQNQPYTDSGVRYEHRHQWRRGQDGKPSIPSSGGATADQIRWGELRFLMGGATSIVGSGGQPGLLRNLDSANQEGLGQRSVNFDTFPLDDSGGARRNGDCNYGGNPTTAASIAADDAYEPHTSEGIDATARNEFLCESSTAYDTMAPGVSNNLLLGKTAMIHAIGLLAPDLGAMAREGTALIWSPRSNITLYGDTARVTAAARLGVEIALGTDWMPTGSMNLLRELRCADSFNKTYLGRYFSDVQLWQMVTVNAASVTATDDVIGLLAPGKVADITVFAGHGKTYRAVLDAEPADVALVMRGGKILYGDGAAVTPFAQDCDAVDVCGTQKRICLMSEIGKTYSQLQTGAGANIYPAFTCTAPPNEPSCLPKRPTYTGVPSATDADGDGIPDAMDKCPMVFDPIRPLDGTAQPDFDADGVGDACDLCPLDANTTTCTPVDPNDRDHDGVPNATDNCPDAANPTQADGDMDGKGDACDPCPATPNPGAEGCAVTIYDIKKGVTPLGTTVHLVNALVTGKGSNGFFVQVKAGDPGDQGAEFSGIFVFTGAGTTTLAAAVVGSRFDIDGRVANFGGQIELDTVTAVTPTPPPMNPPPLPELPAPVVVTYADVKTGGPLAAKLEGVLVAIGAGQVTAVDATFGEFTLTAGSDAIVVDDFVYTPAPAPLPTVGAAFSSATGILAFRQMASKLELRGATDLASGPPALAQLTPALSFARVGQTAGMPTFPAPLTVSLTSPAQADTTVTVMSGDPAALTVTDVTIPMGQISGVVNVTAVAQSAAVTVTASLDGVMKMAMVRVLGAAEAPSMVTLSPATASVPPMGTVQLTATLDLPAPAGGTVVAVTATAGTAPATVMIAANQLSASFTYTAASTSATVTATLGGSMSSAAITVTTAASHLVISQIYGGGGNSGALFANDFVELHNPSTAPLSTAGMSVQYASAAGTSWLVTNLPALTVPAGGFVLVQGASGGAVGAMLPTPDAPGTTNMSATAGKVALVSGQVALSGACPTAGVVDMVGYGATATCSEVNPAPGASNTTAVQRAMNGCTDTDNNSADFAAVAPAPRNSAAAPVVCP